MLLRSNLNRSAYRDKGPELVHFRIRQRNAAVCPVNKPVEPPEPAQTILNAVHHDQTTRIDSVLGCLAAVGSVRIRNMHGQVKAARRILAIENVGSFRSLMVTRTKFWPEGISPESNMVATKLLAVPKQRHAVNALHNNNAISWPSYNGPWWVIRKDAERSDYANRD